MNKKRQKLLFTAMDEFIKSTAKNYSDSVDEAARDCLLDRNTTGYIASFQHIYHGSLSYSPQQHGRHACLKHGYWCFKNLKEHPRDLYFFLKRKLFASFRWLSTVGMPFSTEHTRSS